MSIVYREKRTQTKTYKNMPQNVTTEKGNYLPQTSFTDTINKKTILSNSNYAVSIALFLDFVKKFFLMDYSWTISLGSRFFSIVHIVAVPFLRVYTTKTL